jgi:hypothetical protein
VFYISLLEVMVDGLVVIDKELYPEVDLLPLTCEIFPGRQWSRNESA